MTRQGVMEFMLPDVEWAPPTSFPDLTGQKEIAIDLETCDPWLRSHGPGWAFKDRGYIIGIAVATKGWKGYFPVAHHSGANLDKDVVRKWLQKQLDAPNDKIFHNAQYDVGWLMAEGYTINGKIHDTMMAAPLINENEYSYSLNSLGKQYLNEVKDESLLKEAAQVFSVDPKSEMYKLPPEYVGIYAEQDADLTYRIWQILKIGIKDEDITDIYELESSLLPVLISTRNKGVLIDTDKAQQVKKQLLNEEKKIIKEIKRWYGIEPDLWAAQSLSQVFDRAGLEYPTTPKTKAPSFVAEWLERHEHKLPMAIAKARKINKARTTFIDKMILEHLVDGRIHGELHPLRSDRGGTVTGRFSCSNPNLQQVPARDPMIGNLIRSLFIPEEGHHWGCFDYSQQEPRLTVHYSVLTHQDGAEEAAIEYEDDSADFHQIVADMANISRKEAKIINLGLSYGMGKDKLTQQLGISPEEAEILFDQYHERVPFVRGLRDSASRMGANRGFVKTILGRKCRFNLYEPFDRRETPLPIEKAMDEYGGRLKRAFTYKAMNRLIQGSAADMTKQAMLDLYKEGIVAHTQVHDELNISIKDKKECEKIIEIMRDCVELKVPNKVDAEIGKSWGEVTHYEEYFDEKD
jgi:DNA polymerase I-like protein with 3'-5' exonuclease and polymerase domains|tara:strand:+ start:266 stop:2161 length:1896 start_codon:yes stop_codon:yes gene_type:complete